jgi:glycosyltransferase involved in cell wall biosynthesis
VTLQPEFEAEDSEEVARGAVVVVSHARVAQGRDSWVTKNRMAAVYRELSELGWRVQLVAREGSPSPYLSAPVPGAVEVLPIRPGRGLLRAAVTAARLIRRSPVVLAFMPSLLGSFAALIAGRRAVVYSGSSWTLQGSSRRRMWLERAVARRAAAVVAHGEALQRLFATSGARVYAAVPFVEPEVASRMAGGFEAPRDTGRPLHVLFVGSIGRAKGVRTLVEALRVVSDPVETHFVGPVGDIESRDVLEAYLRDVPDAAWTGYLEWPELRAEYQWADLLVLPSRSEGFPRVVYEATAFGAALIVTPVGGIPYTLEDERDALIVPIDATDALAKAICRAAGDPGLGVSLNQGARVALAPVFASSTSGELLDRLLLVAHAASEFRESAPKPVVFET